ncbi:MAG: c-type cytochrome biogenesis protein CcmI [Gammaproteobacteria bacterium]|nr:c-type cytochrome biogenesis protein CcmI [Gammaproteobacteria bacterium]
MWFWITVIGLAAVSLAFVIPPLLKKAELTDERRREINVAIYKERLNELKQTGLTKKQLEQTKQELELTLVQDLGDASSHALKPRARWASIVVALCLPGLAVGGYWFSGVPDAEQRAQAARAAAAELPPMNELIARVKARLQKTPDDPKGWQMLARTYSFQERYREASEAYAKAIALAGEDDPQLLAEYAGALIFAEDGRFAARPLELIQRALSLDADNRKALWLAAIAAEEEQESLRAAGYWQRLLALLPEGSEEWQSVKDRLAKTENAGDR